MSWAGDQFRQVKPPHDLAPYVDAIVGRRAGCAPCDFEVFPAARVELLFHFADPFLASPADTRQLRALQPAALLGPRTARCRQRAGPRIDWLIVQLSPAGCQRFLGHPAGALIDVDAPLERLLPCACDLWSRMAGTRSFDRRAELAVAWLRGRPTRRVGDDEVSRVATLSRTRAMSSARQLAGMLDLGERRLRQRFAAEVGMSPKSWLSLMRANRFLWGLHPSARAASFEYADDSHAIREFKRFSGMTPGAYRSLKAGGDPLVNTGRNQPW